MIACYRIEDRDPGRSAVFSLDVWWVFGSDPLTVDAAVEACCACWTGVLSCNGPGVDETHAYFAGLYAFTHQPLKLQCYSVDNHPSIDMPPSYTHAPPLV